MTAQVVPIERAGGRGRQPSVIERIRDLEDELTARDVEQAALAAELEALSRRTQLAIHAERPDVALHVAGRLDALAAALSRRGAA